MARRSPYLKDWRLADVLAALTVMGRNVYSSRPAEGWVEFLDSPRSAQSWAEVFGDHPEFFRLSDEEAGWASLRLRHGLERTYSVRLRRELTPEELEKVPPGSEEFKDIARRPLSPAELEALTKTAIELHGSAIAHEGERRWLTPLLFGLLGTVLGVVLQAAIR